MKISAGIVPTFTLPKTKPFVFEKVYTAADEDSTQRLHEASQLREAVAAATTQGDSAAAASAIDLYIPVLHGVISSVAEHNGMPNTRGGLVFAWSSGGDKDPGKQYYSLYTLGYEMCMVVATRAYCACNLAAQELESPSGMGDEPSKRALAQLKSAASMFAAIAARLLPLNESLPVQRALEVLPLYHRSLELLCRTSCQLLAINQAVIRGMSVALVAKLYSGASQLCTASLQQLTALRNDWNEVDPSLRNFVSGACHYFLAVGLRLQAQTDWETGKHGEAVAQIRESKKRFDKAYSGGIMHYASKSLTERVDADRSQTVDLLALYEKENGLIYFAQVPTAEPNLEAKTVAAETSAWSIAAPSIRVVFRIGNTGNSSDARVAV
mmetsp:Transcript_17112/g.43114  ORF Transcript_17112/g.43114 Transcript_17112/m.43114 type:complete len:382 (-) Transcript_17112:294-1439(-)|eukprot:CAMPEP_0174924028 /NCGR_PEP_ID=MMETSP1355-20121228/6969_1 /TAXON_ID=464990 /ORGANISM="Hemiselmis tepida, Strain CCMP443" /LENGTH=381 /DNA_ID=CAMNT_0016169775 /DNA_START=38 /DNA_END=1183 /DNA_ORIENTATION=-